jgi:hypothetical protein
VINPRRSLRRITLKRASKHRSGGPWNDDDYDVFDGEQHIGRITLHPQAPQGAPWFWTITARFPLRRGNQDGSRASIRMRELRRARDEGRA